MIPKASKNTTVLLIHAPYPGNAKFDGIPSSLLAAMAPFVRSGFAGEQGESLGFLDPIASSESFYRQLREIARAGRLKSVCISSSTAAIEETARIAGELRAFAPRDCLIVAGGPHEDDCDLKIAEAISGVDISIAGEAEHLLDALLRRHLRAGSSPRRTVEEFGNWVATSGRVAAGRGVMTSQHWADPRSRTFDFGPLPTRHLGDLPAIDKSVQFDVFDRPATKTIMISRGCAYGRCTFCSEGNRGDGQLTTSSFAWIDDWLPDPTTSAVYFQDSIFPANQAVRTELLPKLKAWGGKWGCQLYLPGTSEPWLRDLERHGCRYVYAGLETSSAATLQAIGKGKQTAKLALQKIEAAAATGLFVGLSLMFGNFDAAGRLLESEASVAETLQLVAAIRGRLGDRVAFYPNILTLLPGTRLAKGLEQNGRVVDFYRQPRTRAFGEFEDGGVGHNFSTLELASPARRNALLSILAEIPALMPSDRELGSQENYFSPALS